MWESCGSPELLYASTRKSSGEKPFTFLLKIWIYFQVSFLKSAHPPEPSRGSEGKGPKIRGLKAVPTLSTTHKPLRTPACVLNRPRYIHLDAGRAGAQRPPATLAPPIQTLSTATSGARAIRNRITSGRRPCLIHPTSTSAWPPLGVDGAMIMDPKRAALRGAYEAQAAACLALQVYVQFLNPPLLDSTSLIAARLSAPRFTSGPFSHRAARGRNARTPERSCCATVVARALAHGAAPESATAGSTPSAP